jgi:hypothetical protein
MMELLKQQRSAVASTLLLMLPPQSLPQLKQLFKPATDKTDLKPQMLQDRQTPVALWIQTYLMHNSSSSSRVMLQQSASQVWALQQALLYWMTLSLLAAAVVVMRQVPIWEL